MANDDSFTVYIYANEYEYLKWLVLQKQFIETGGDLFGVWQSEHCVVVQFVLGPGKKCRRSVTSFHQDVNYLDSIGRYLTTNEGVCNIGEWHSHHRIGLFHPSGGDQDTVWRHIEEVSGRRFLLFIANIKCIAEVKVGCFMFNADTRKMTQGKLKLLPNCSPIRHMFVNETTLTLEAEPAQDWGTFRASKMSRARYFENEVGGIETNERCCVCSIAEEQEVKCCTCLKGAIAAISCKIRLLGALFVRTVRCIFWATIACLTCCCRRCMQFFERLASD